MNRKKISQSPLGFAVFLAIATSGLLHAESTTFIHDSSSMDFQGDWFSQEFTISAPTSFVLRFASDYSADAAVVPASQISNFRNGRSYTGFGVMSGKFGTQYINNLPAGNYFVVCRSRVKDSNQYCIELDNVLRLETSNSKSFSFAGQVAASSRMVGKNGGKLWQPFTVVEGYRYFVDGCNSGLDTYFIPESELSNFKSNKTFQYYTDYSGQRETNLPGQAELRLAPGNYYLCFHNTDPKISKAVTYSIDAWSENNSGPDSIALSGSASWKVTGRNVDISVEKIENNRPSGSVSGTLRLTLWATSSPYEGGGITGYVLGRLQLAGQLSGGFYRENIQGLVPYTRPRAGSYFTTLTLEEFSGSGWEIVSHVSFVGQKKF